VFSIQVIYDLSLHLQLNIFQIMLNEEQFFRQLASHTVAAVRIQVASRTEQMFAGNRRGGRRQVVPRDVSNTRVLALVLPPPIQWVELALSVWQTQVFSDFIGRREVWSLVEHVSQPGVPRPGGPVHGDASSRRGRFAAGSCVHDIGLHRVWLWCIVVDCGRQVGRTLGGGIHIIGGQQFAAVVWVH